MKYILDFDRTVFDMESLYQAIAKQNPDATLGTVESLEGIDLEQFLFADALEFFVQHAAENIEIVSSGFGLTGQWELAYQTEKIRRSNVTQYVAKSHVVTDSKIAEIKQIAESAKEVVYVDDHPENIANALENIDGLQVVYIDRSGEGKVITGAATISLLTELDKITV